jgi:TonB family protein
MARSDTLAVHVLFHPSEERDVSAAAKVYTWEDPGSSIRIQISLDLVERLAAAMQEGLGTGARGIEIGGILLGRRLPGSQRAVLIEDFELAPCQHLRGASYTLSPKERENLGARLARHEPERVAGYFRSHTRPGLYLDQDDFATISGYFPDPSNVFLVVRPSAEGPATGGFFFWEEGDINRKSTYRQFAFDRAQLEAGVSRTGLRPAAPAAAKHSVVPEPATQARYRVPPVSWLAVPAIAGVFLAAGLFVSRNHASKQPQTVVPAAVRAPRQPELSLDVERTGDALRVRWDPNLPAVRQAALGVLWITDGGQQFRRELDPQELAEGSTTYTPVSNDVNFELRIFALTDQTNKSFEEIAPAPAPTQVAGSEAPPGAPAASRPVPEALGKPSPFRASRAKRPRIPVPAPVTAARALPHVEPPPPLPAERHPAELAGALPFHSLPSLPPAPEAAVSYETPRASAFRRALRKISPFGDPDAPDAFVPPAPIRKVSPAVPDGDAQGSVDVKVYIDESGKVSRAQLLTKDSDLADAALNAARQWHFTPARKRDKPVPSEMVLHFRFGGEM